MPPPGSEVELGAIICGWGGEGGSSGRPSTSPYLPKDAQPRIVVVDALGGEDEPSRRASPEGFINEGDIQFILLKTYSRQKGISASSLQGRVERAAERVRTLQGLDFRSHRRTLYCVSDLDLVCNDLLLQKPQAGEDETLEHEGVRYATLARLVFIIGLSRSAIERRIRSAGVQVRSLMGRTSIGRIREFFAILDVQKLCADLLVPEMPDCDDDGFIKVVSRLYGHQRALAILLNLDASTIMVRIEHDAVSSILGKDKAGRVQKFYSVSETRQRCSDLLEMQLQVDENNELHVEGETYITEGAFSERTGVSRWTVRTRVKPATEQMLRRVKAKSKNRRLLDFFSESDLKTLFEDLLTYPELANKEGILLADKIEWVTEKVGARECGCSSIAIRMRVRRGGIRCRQGRDFAGNIRTFYALVDLREATADVDKRRGKRVERGVAAVTE